MNNFDINEFKCPCCGIVSMDYNFLCQIDLARDIANIPFDINSGYRCEKHNKEVGSTSRNHVDGKGADISAKTGYKRGHVLKGLYGAGFKRVGIHKDFIHVDSMDKAESCWLY